MKYYIQYQGQSIGPMTAEQVMSYNPSTDTQVSCNGSPWAPLYTYPELMQYYNTQRNNVGISGSLGTKKLLAGLMAIFFGYLGVQYFVVGKVAGGFICILLTLVTCGLWEVVSLVQGIMMLCMSEEEFENKYINNPATFPLF